MNTMETLWMTQISWGFPRVIIMWTLHNTGCIAEMKKNYMSENDFLCIAEQNATQNVSLLFKNHHLLLNIGINGAQNLFQSKCFAMQNCQMKSFPACRQVHFFLLFHFLATQWKTHQMSTWYTLHHVLKTAFLFVLFTGCFYAHRELCK